MTVGLQPSITQASASTGPATLGTAGSAAAPVVATTPVGQASRFERRAMGSPLRLQLVGLEAAAALDAWSSVSEDVERTEAALSRHRETGELALLNAAGGAPVVVGARLYAALAAAERAWRATGGRFDPRVLEDLERLGQPGAGKEASAARGRDGGGRSTARPARARAMDTWLRWDPGRREVRLSSRVDLDGIGKGLALRWAWRRLLRATGREPVGALLEAGGDLVAQGPAPQGGAWLVGIEDPLGGPDPLAVVAVSQGAVCTSSTAVHRWVSPDGIPAHHLIDPRTGLPGGKSLLAVSVAAPDPAWAEVWSKALFLAGNARIGTLAHRDGFAAWWVDGQGRVEASAAGRRMTGWVDVRRAGASWRGGSGIERLRRS